MSDSNEARRTQKREWARKDREARAARGELSYTSEWRRKNPDQYLAQKQRAIERRKVAREAKP